VTLDDLLGPAQCRDLSPVDAAIMIQGRLEDLQAVAADGADQILELTDKLADAESTASNETERADDQENRATEAELSLKNAREIADVLVDALEGAVDAAKIAAMRKK
jgi:hypothetical protein